MAYEFRVPAGDALAVDRELFGAAISKTLRSHSNISVVEEQVQTLPDDGDCIVATGPLTADALAKNISELTGTDRLYFYDAIAPIIDAESIDKNKVFAASRYDKGEGADYLNCPLTKEEYEAFVSELVRAEYMPLADFEEPKYFQGCLPIEVVAQSGPDTLRFGTMKPVGLTDPSTGRWPYAVVQLRKEDKDGQAYNIVGFQTKMKHGEQKRIFRMLAGLENVEFLRFGAIHRNTYLNSPLLLDERLRLKCKPNVRFAGQITGVEGYVESAAQGLLTALLFDDNIMPPPRSCALGALYSHIRGQEQLPNRSYEPQNIHWAMFAPVTEKSKMDRKAARVLRAQETFAAWKKTIC
jgi:methylenetetrahydrofolate--tRNA-(uracil-5-)-methyltransferase